MNVSPLPRQDDLASLRVLEEIERDPSIPQRELSRRVGISLGMTNLLLKRMAKKAWIKIRSVPGRRVLYALTPRGMAEKYRKTRDFVRLSLRYYGDVKASLLRQVRECGVDHPRVATWGAGDFSEIVAEAAHRAGGEFVATPADRPDVVVLLEKAPRSRRETWERSGAHVIDLS